MDIYYQRVRGFYVSSPFREFSTHKPERYPQLPDALAVNYGMNWYHIFHPEVFSLKAAFAQSEFQLKSGGSWLINPFYNHLELSLGSRFIPGIEDSSITAIPNLATGRFDTIGSSWAYGYSYIDGHFFASVILGAGPALQSQRLQREDQNNTQNYSLALKINMNAAVGWNSQNYVGGLKFLFDSLSSNVAGTQVASNLWSGQVFLGTRF